MMVFLIFIIFMLGLFSLLCSLFDVITWLIPWLSFGYMAVAYIMLTFIWKKEQEGEKETLVKKIVELESKIG